VCARPEDVIEAKNSGLVYAVKLYPAGATTNSQFGVTSVNRIKPTLSAMASLGMPLLVHGEVTDSSVDIFDREKVFIDSILRPLRLEFPTLKVSQIYSLYFHPFINITLLHLSISHHIPFPFLLDCYGTYYYIRCGRFRPST
jgi:hypothetical protein